MARSRSSSVDLITIGDCMVDTFLQIHEATVACRVETGSCTLCMEYGEKIPVESMMTIAGAGNASNAAIGATRLGMKTAVMSVIGDDEVGKQIIKTWKREGVVTPLTSVDHKHPTSMSTVLRFQGDRTILVYNQPRTYVLPKLPISQWIYYTALGPKHEKLEHALLMHLKRFPHIRLAANPGPHQIRRGHQRLEPLIRRSDLFVVNREEAMHILGMSGSPQRLLKQFLQLGAKCIVITDAAKGAWASNGMEEWHMPVFPIDPVDSTGAGDSFATAMLYAFSLDLPLHDALRYGAANAWSVIQHVGPHAGLLHHNQLKNVLKKFSHLQPNRIK